MGRRGRGCGKFRSVAGGAAGAGSRGPTGCSLPGLGRAAVGHCCSGRHRGAPAPLASSSPLPALIRWPGGAEAGGGQGCAPEVGRCECDKVRWREARDGARRGVEQRPQRVARDEAWQRRVDEGLGGLEGMLVWGACMGHGVGRVWPHAHEAPPPPPTHQPSPSTPTQRTAHAVCDEGHALQAGVRRDQGAHLVRKPLPAAVDAVPCREACVDRAPAAGVWAGGRAGGGRLGGTGSCR